MSYRLIETTKSKGSICSLPVWCHTVIKKSQPKSSISGVIRHIDTTAVVQSKAKTSSLVSYRHHKVKRQYLLTASVVSYLHLDTTAAMQNKKAVSAYLISRRIPPLGFAKQRWPSITDGGPTLQERLICQSGGIPSNTVR